MPLSRRYTPEHPPGESCLFGLDFSAIIPVGRGVKSGTLAILSNTAFPTDSSADWEIGPVLVRGRAIYANLSGGLDGHDYQLIWTAVDTDGNVFPRTALILVGNTS